MSGKVLLYNIKDAKKRASIQFCLFKQGLAAVDVAAEDLGHPLGYLLGLEGYAPAPAEEVFTEEMLVMHNLTPAQFNGLLDGLRRARATVALKAMVTDTNVAWSSARLHREIAAEHAAMRQKQGSIH